MTRFKPLSRAFLVSVALLTLIGCASFPRQRASLAAGYFNLGNELYALADYKKAALMYNKAIAFDPKPLTYHFNYLKALIAGKNYKVAEMQVNYLLKEQKDNLIILKSQAFLAAIEGQTAQALSLYSKILTQYPYDSTSLLNRLVLREKLGDLSSAQILKEYKALDREGIVDAAKSPSLLALAALFQKDKKYAVARSLAQKAIAKDKKNEQAYRLMIKITEAEGNHKKLSLFYQTALAYLLSSKGKGSPDLYFTVGSRYLLEEQNDDRAQKAFLVAIETGFKDQDKIDALIKKLSGNEKSVYTQFFQDHPFLEDSANQEEATSP